MAQFADNTNELSKYFDHTILKADTSVGAVKLVCEEALKHSFASVCVNSFHVPLVAALLKDSTVKTCAVVGFPLGATSTESKIFEAEYCGRNGAQEIDMVVNVGLIKECAFDRVKDDIERVVEACHKMNMLCKVILEVCLLTDEEKRLAATCALQAHADFVKTSTGFSTSGATVGDVELLSKLAHDEGACCKASGGIRTGKQALAMIAAGADRLGTSATVQVYEECKALLQAAAEASSTPSDAAHSAYSTLPTAQPTTEDSNAY